MSGWGTNGNANRIKDTYIKGFLDISGGPLIVEKTSSLQIIAHDSDNPVIEFKSEYFTVNTTSAIDVSYSALASLGLLGVSFEQSTAGIIERVKYITTGEIGVDPNKVFYTKIGNDDEKSDLQVYGHIKGHYGLEIDGDVSFNNNFFVAGDSSMNNDLSVGGNLYVGKRSVFSLDASFNGNTKLGSGNRSVAINKDISSAFALDVSGLTVLRNTLFVGSDVSLNNNLYVNNDLSLNGNLYVVKRSLFTLDVSMLGNLDVGSGSSSVAINKDISSAFALDVSGATILRNTLSVGSNVTFDGSLSVANITEPNPAGHCNLWTNSTGGNINIGTQSATGLYLKGTTIEIQGGAGLPMTINTTGSVAITNTEGATAGFITGPKTVGVNIGTGNFTTATGIMSIFTGNSNDSSSKLNIGTGTSNAGEINIATGGSRPLTSNTNIGGTVNLGSATSKTSVLGIMNVTNDASLNGNVKLGSGNRSVAINKDLSAGYALDVSGLTILRNNLFVENDVSFNSKLFVGTDVSINGDLRANSITTAGNMNAYNITASNVMTANSIQSSTTETQMDIATNQIGGVLNIGTETTRTGIINIGTGTTAKNIYIGTKSGSGATTLQMSGSAISIGQSNTSTLNLNPNTTGSGTLNMGNGMAGGTINMGTGMTGGTINIGNNGTSASTTPLNIATGSNVNGPINIGNSASAKTINIGGTSTTLVLAGSSISTANDASLNGNVKLGSGNRSVAINKDISSDFALDVSGSTVLRNTLYVGSDVSFNTKLFVGGDVSMNSKLSVGNDVSFNSKLFVRGDVSMNSKLSVGNDVSMNSKLSVGGDVSFNSKLFVRGDASMNGNLLIGNDLSLNGNLYVVKRSVFTLDVSMLGNLDIGSGSSSFAINKDISSAFALDVSGVSQFRGNVDVSGTFTVNGAPVNAGGSLTGNVQVGSNSGFVTINKPQFYSDPSLTIYYDFDTLSYTGTTIANKGNGGAGLTATLQGTTTGMIDSTNFKYGTASLRNEYTPSNNQGIKVNTSVPIGTNMTFSFWIRKRSTPPATTFDRIFEFSENTTAQGNENNSIALDISSSGIILPVLTNGTASCFGTLSTPIISSYNVCDDAWKHIVWSINGSSSVIYVNGSNTQQDTITGLNPFAVSATRTSAIIGNSNYNVGTRDFSGNIDDFRYYKDKALSYAEIYQLYNNNFYTLDICGGFLANGSSVIYEPVGSVATANSGTLTLLHGDASGASSIMFKSVNSANDYAYVQYEDNNTITYIQSFYKWNLSPGANNTYNPTNTVDTSVGSNTTQTLFVGSVSSAFFSVVAPSPPSTFPSNAYCISFNQTNQTGTTPITNSINYLQSSSITSSSNITISFWIRPNISWDTSNPGGGIFYTYNIAHFINSSNTSVIDIYIRGFDQRLFVLINGNGTNYKYTTLQIINNAWTHVAFTYSASPNNGFIYINGVRDEFTVGTGYTTFGTLNYNNLLLGMKFGGNNGGNYLKGFRGYMNFINIFNQTLSDSNITYLYNNPSYGQTTEGGLMTIGIENDSVYNDRIALWSNGGTGYVGINTKTPQATLDISGNVNINADAIINDITVGKGGGKHYSNTAVGFQALPTSGPWESVAVGYTALNKTNNSNHAFGFRALYNCLTGANNTGIGYNTLEFVTTASQNTAIGRNAGNGLTTSAYQWQGDGNTFLGMVTGMTGGNWSNSTAVGYEATITASNQIKLGTNNSTVMCGNNLLMQGNGSECYIRNTAASTLYLGTDIYNYVWINSSGLTVNRATGTLLTLQNTSFVYAGSQTSIEFMTGTGNFPMGRISAVDTSPNGQTFSSVMIFYIAIGTVSTERMRITSTAVIAQGYNTYSDYRAKENVVPLDASFTVDGLNPVTYNLKSTGRQDIGFIAHEVQEFYPFLVLGEKDGKDTQSLNYNGFIGILTKEIKVLKKKVADQEARIVEQERKALDQEARIQALEKMVFDLINK